MKTTNSTRHILERTLANSGPMAPQQRRAMWAKRNHPQPTNPKLMDVRVAGGQLARAVGPQADIITRPSGTPLQPVARFVPPAEHATAPLEPTPAFRQWLAKLAEQRASLGPRNSGLPSHPGYNVDIPYGFDDRSVPTPGHPNPDNPYQTPPFIPVPPPTPIRTKYDPRRSIGVPHVLPINLPNLPRLPRQHHVFNRAAGAIRFLKQQGAIQ